MSASATQGGHNYLYKLSGKRLSGKVIVQGNVRYPIPTYRNLETDPLAAGSGRDGVLRFLVSSTGFMDPIFRVENLRKCSCFVSTGQ